MPRSSPCPPAGGAPSANEPVGEPVAGPLPAAPPPSAESAGYSYLHTVERFVLQLRGRGLMLSPADVRLIDAWRLSGIPLRVVCEALLAGAEHWRANTHGEPLPHTLRYFDAGVRRAGRRWGGEQAVVDPEGADAPEPAAGPAVLDTLRRELAAVGRTEQQPLVREAYRRAYRELGRIARRLQHEPRLDWLAATSEVDRSLVTGLFEALPDDARAELGQLVEAALEPERHRLGVKAYAERRDAEVDRQVRLRYGLVRLCVGFAGAALQVAWRRPEDEPS